MLPRVFNPIHDTNIYIATASPLREKEKTKNSDCSELGLMKGEVQLAPKKRLDERTVKSELAEPKKAWIRLT